MGTITIKITYDGTGMTSIEQYNKFKDQTLALDGVKSVQIMEYDPTD